MNLSNRRKTPTVKVGHIRMGGNHPIVIQSMTNTPTADISSTINQIKQLSDAGAELVRITINDDTAAKAASKIIHRLRAEGYDVPIIGDLHFNGHLLLSRHPETAKLLDKYRINPGNVGKGKSHDSNFGDIVKIAVANNKPVRIGVNWGSLDQELAKTLLDKNAKLKKPKDIKDVLYQAMVKSVLDSAEFALKLGLKKEKLVISAKMSDTQDLIVVNELLAEKCDFVLHLGLTEAGGGTYGICASCASLAVLLQKGIGDTIRISITPHLNQPRSLEVDLCKNLLQSLGLRYFEPSVTSCPGCGRTQSDDFQHLAEDIKNYIKSQMPFWKQKYPDIAKLKIAVMGCVVNGPGESKHADIGISLPGLSEKPSAVIYINGEKTTTLSGRNIKNAFIKILNKYIIDKYKK